MSKRRKQQEESAGELLANLNRLLEDYRDLVRDLLHERNTHRTRAEELEVRAARLLRRGMQPKRDRAVTNGEKIARWIGQDRSMAWIQQQLGDVSRRTVYRWLKAYRASR